MELLHPAHSSAPHWTELPLSSLQHPPPLDFPFFNQRAARKKIRFSPHHPSRLLLLVQSVLFTVNIRSFSLQREYLLNNESISGGAVIHSLSTN